MEGLVGGTIIYLQGSYWYSPDQWHDSPAEAIQGTVGRGKFAWVGSPGWWATEAIREAAEPLLDALRKEDWLPQWPGEWVDLRDTGVPVPEALLKVWESQVML